MTFKISTATELAFALGMVLGLSSISAIAQEGWTVTNHIPAPPHASAELFNAISKTPPPPIVKDLPTSVQGWIDMSVIGSESFAFLGKALAAQWNIKVEPADIAGVPVFWVTPPEVAPQNKDRLFIHTHGGGFSMGFGEAAVVEALSIAKFATMRVVSIDYRTIPLHPYPAALNDVLAVYTELLKENDPAAMAIGGSSAGGNLSISMFMRVCRTASF